MLTGLIFTIVDILILSLQRRILIGIGITAAGILAVISLPEKASLNCDRVTQECTLKNGLWHNQSSIKFPLNQLLGATLEEISQTKGKSYRVLLTTPTKPIKFTSRIDSVILITDSAGFYSKRKIVGQINEFLANPQQRSLQVEQDESTLAFLFGFTFTIIGILSCTSQKKRV